MCVEIRRMVVVVATLVASAGCGPDQSRNGSASSTGSSASIGSPPTLIEFVAPDPADGSVDSTASVADSRCDAVPVVPSFAIDGDDRLDPGSWSVDGEVASLEVDGNRVALSVTDGSAAIDLMIEDSGITEIDLAAGRDVVVEYRRNQGFEGDARAVRVSDQFGVVMLVEDGDYGNALPPADLAPFTIGQTDIGCRNRENAPGSLNNFALVVEAAGPGVVVMPGERAIIGFGGREYAAQSLRSTSRHGDARWTDAPTMYTSFSIVRLPS